MPIWGPTPLTKNLLVTGTWSGSESNESFLRVSQQDPKKGLCMIGMAQSPTKFSTVDWID